MAGDEIVKVDRGGDDPFEGSGKELSLTRGESGKAVKNTLERGWVRHRLIRDLAIREKTNGELAKRYGVSANAISNFRKRHVLEIEEVTNSLADEYAGVWVARKLDRIREYQNAAEKMANGESARSQEVLVNILKAVAEELGDLPARTQVNVSNNDVTYQVIGIDPEDLT